MSVNSHSLYAYTPKRRYGERDEIKEVVLFVDLARVGHPSHLRSYSTASLSHLPTTLDALSEPAELGEATFCRGQFSLREREAQDVEYH
jgi:hypothetical protein